MQVSGFAQRDRPATMSFGIEVGPAAFEEGAAELAGEHQVGVSRDDDGIHISLFKQVAEPDLKFKPRLHIQCDTGEAETVGRGIKRPGTTAGSFPSGNSLHSTDLRS